MNTNIPAKPFFRTDEAAELFDVTRKTIYNWIETGKMDAFKVGGSLRIKREVIINIIDFTTQ